MMKTKIIGILCLIVIGINVYVADVEASSGSGLVTVGKDCTFTTAVSNLARTGNYDYIEVAVHSVYPVGNYDEDNYQKCKAAVFKNDGTRISDTKTIKEGTGYEKLTIYNGYLNLKKVNLGFAGNNPNYSANIDYSYKGK